MPRVETRRLDELRVEESIDPRLQERSQERIERYADNIDNLPPIEIDQHNRIIDGVHRVLAHRLVGRVEILVKVIIVESETDAIKRAISSNAKHGIALTVAELKQASIRLWRAGATEAQIAKTIARGKTTVDNYLADAKRHLKDKQINEVVKLYKTGFNQTQIAKTISENSQRSITQRTVSTYLRDHLVEQAGKMHEVGRTEQKIENELKRDFPRLIKVGEVSKLIREYDIAKQEKEAEQAAKEAAQHELENTDSPTEVADAVAEEVIPALAEADPTTETETQEHKKMQWMLLWLGSKLNLSLWVASDNRSESYEGKAFVDLPGMLSHLPTGIRASVPRSTERIDVLWLDKDKIVAAFEVEHSTGIDSGLLRMSDMFVAINDPSIRINIVAPDDDLRRVQSKFERPTFRENGLAESCRYISYMGLTDAYNEAEGNGSFPYDWQGLLDRIGHKL